MKEDLRELAGATQDAFRGVVDWAQKHGIGAFLPNLAEEKVLIIANDARVDYLLAFPDEAAQQVEAIIDVAIVKHHLLLTPKEVGLCFARGKEGQQIGKVVDVDLNRGLVLQSVGQGRGALHCISDLGKVPEVGDVLDVRYRAGKAAVQDRVAEVGRGR